MSRDLPAFSSCNGRSAGPSVYKGRQSALQLPMLTLTILALAFPQARQFFMRSAFGNLFAHAPQKQRMIGMVRMEQSHEQAYLQAFDEYADALFRHARFRLASRERATDLVQDTFIKAWDYLRDGGEVEHWKSFLYRVLNNLIIDEYRRTKEESLDALMEESPLAENPLLASEGRTEIEEHADTKLLMEHIRARLPDLPDSYRTVLTMRYIDGFSPKEISQMLGLSENVVSVRIHRGVTRLRELCQPLINL